MCTAHKVAWLLVIVGALNWGLVGAFNVNLVMMLFGKMAWLERTVYVLVGLAALMMLGIHKCCVKDGMMAMGAKKMMEKCPCGSGKMYWQCCGKAEAEKMADMPCPCGSGKMAKDCCMKSPETHKM